MAPGAPMLGTSAPPEPIEGSVGFAAASSDALSVAHRLVRPAVIALVAFAVAVGVWYAAQVIVLDHSAAAAVDTSVARVKSPLRPDDTLQVTARGAGVELQRAQLFRADVAADSSRSAEQAIPIRLEPTGQEGVFQIVATDGTSQLLRPDGAYRLTVRAVAPRPALPLPRTDSVERQYQFSTVASPHLKAPTSALQPRWSEPVSVSWSEPVRGDFALSVQPPAPVRAWLDSRDATRTWIQLGGEGGAGLTDGQTYDVTISSAQGADGIALQQPVNFKVAVPARPHFVDLPSGPVTLRYGDTFTLTSDVGLVDANVTTAGDVAANVSVQGNQVRLALPDYRQGTEFDLNVASATSPLGAPLAQPVKVHFVTPPAFGAPEFDPEDDTVGVQPGAHPSITFPEPVADQAAAQRALSIDPSINGKWQWTAPDTVVFVPDDHLPILTDVTITLHGGPGGPRTAAGGYLEKDVSTTFRTTDYKRMDVSLSRQTMTLIENGVPIRTIYVATGVAAAPTPTGTFYVQMKAPEMRFRGVNPDGSHYDIPDVHWVMPFWGDYTIHGAYWRPRFGVPGSDGCVSMTDADAKAVYDWANVGTPIDIHY